MKTIELTSHVGKDGILRLELPIDMRNHGPRCPGGFESGFSTSTGHHRRRPLAARFFCLHCRGLPRGAVRAGRPG